MTFTGILIGIIFTAMIIVPILKWYNEGEIKKSTTVAICILCVAVIWGGLIFYYKNTASGQRAVVDQHSELANGLEREINVYTADGNLIAHYKGKIDLEDNEGGYVIFDWDGKRYTYYNCFVESIADIK